MYLDMPKDPEKWSDFDLSNLFDKRTLVIEDEEFVVSSVYLSMYSGFFRALFSTNFKESSESTIPLPEINKDVFEVFLDSIYPCHLPVTEASAPSLMVLAYRFDVPYLMNMCDDIMYKAVEGNRMSAFTPLSLAATHGQLDKCIRYATLFVDWKNFMGKNKKPDTIDDTLKSWIFDRFS